MKTSSLFFMMAFLCLIFSQCSKQHDPAQNGQKAVVRSMVEAMQTGAQFMCENCQESPGKITGATAQNLAFTYAPLLKFDRAAPDYPTSVENVLANTDPASIVCGGQLVLTNRDAPRSMDFPTYYEVQQHPNDANKVFIDYWWTYKNQPNCFGSLGGHDYDWEHMVVQVNKQTNRVVTVTYFQHAGWYTKDWRNVAQGTRIEGYVGKKAHGMYHFSNSITLPGVECSYYGDYRNPDGAKDQVLSGNNLVAISCNIAGFSFNGNWGTIGRGPLYRDRAYWNYGSCNGSDGLFGTDGCSKSDFPVGTKIGSL